MTATGGNAVDGACSACETDLLMAKLFPVIIIS